MKSELPEFNLIRQPWVRVRWLTGEVEELSLAEVFVQAPQIRGLAGELPSQDAAVLRLMLAIMLAATRPDYQRNEFECLDLWESWSQPDGFPTEVVIDYLDWVAERFELFSSTTPFMQVPDLHTASGKASGLGKIIAELPDGHQYFTTRAGEHVKSLSFAEAARWLVHCQQFDPAGIKSGAVGDERVKGGKGYSFGYPAWAGNLGVVILEGANLAETLLLNLPLLQTNPSDLPVWERPQSTAAADASHPVPVGPADAFTWPSRRVRLLSAGGRVIDVQISNGDRLPPQNLNAIEPMSAWRHSKNQSKRGQEVQMPTTHTSDRLIWQGLAALLSSSSEPGARVQMPGAVEWLAKLAGEGAVEPTRPVRLRAIGVEYGTMNSVIDAVVSDSLGAHVIALTDPVLRQTAIDAADRASKAVFALVRLGRDLDTAAGSKRDDKAREEADQRSRESGYAVLDGPYRRWLAELNDPSQGSAALQSWGDQARDLLSEVGREMVAAAGPDAWQGRTIKVQAKGQPGLMDSARAHLYFLAALKKATGAGAEQTNEEA